MPEGHLIHAYARRQRRELGGSAVGVSSPQGRFAREAGLLDGRTLASVEAYGKHLIYDLGRLLHVHLGMAGVSFPLKESRGRRCGCASPARERPGTWSRVVEPVGRGDADERAARPNRVRGSPLGTATRL
jgi:formamidopyrimidine-DNA glycosylase